MKVKHGIETPFEKETFSRGEIAFWWCGEKIDQGEFNKRLFEQTRIAGITAQQMLEGIKQSLSKAIRTELEREIVEKILRGPLCEVCKMMIENMKP